MITKSAADKTNFTQDLVFTDSARTAWSHLLFGFKNAAHPTVLMPSYIGFTEREGSGVFDPIQETSSDYKFYKLDDCLRIDLDDFTRILKSGAVNVALVIHYFGLCRNNMEKIKGLCTEHNVLLVEDCAHALGLGLTQGGLGSYGDYSFYSLHKFITTDAGGALKVNKKTVTLPPLPLVKRISADDLEQYVKTRLVEVANMRRDNFKFYLEYLRPSVDLEVMYELLDEDIPQSFPLKIKKGRREALYFYLINRSIPVTALYYRLIEQISADQFPVSFNVSAEILNLPVHQDITHADIRLICSSISDFSALGQ